MTRLPVLLCGRIRGSGVCVCVYVCMDVPQSDYSL